MMPSQCDRCRARLPQHGYYVAKIEVFADPSIPEINTASLADVDFSGTVDALLDEMNRWSTQELEAQVYKRFDFRLCAKCQALFIRDPLGAAQPRPTGIN
jgi:ribosomal protein L40E